MVYLLTLIKCGYDRSCFSISSIYKPLVQVNPKNRIKRYETSSVSKETLIMLSNKNLYKDSSWEFFYSLLLISDLKIH